MSNRTYIIAEAACNHECDMDVARKMIDAAHECGADAIKFQTYKAEKLVTDHAEAYWGDKPMKQVDYYKQLDRFGKDEYKRLFAYAKRVGIDAFSTPFDEESATMLASLDVPYIKIASCEITNIGLLEHIAKLGKPVILSTGGAVIIDVVRAVNILDEHVKVSILACVLSNPATQPCLNRIRYLKHYFPFHTVGYSDHTLPDNHVVPMMAVAAGAEILEKHFTIDKSMSISNHFFAADIEQMRSMVEAVRLAEENLGEHGLLPTDEESKPRVAAARSWHAARDINKRDVISREDIEYLRPGGGLSYSCIDTLVGAVAGRNIKKGHMFTGEEIVH